MPITTKEIITCDLCEKETVAPYVETSLMVSQFQYVKKCVICRDCAAKKCILNMLEYVEGKK